MTTTTTTVTSTTTTRRQSNVVKKKVKKRRRKVHRKRRTYVVEYDIDDYNNKFGIKTAKRVIRKRRRKTKKSKKKSGIKCSRRNQSQNPDAQNVVEGILSGSSTKGLRQEYPKLHLFGDKNALEYFSGDSDNDEGIGSLNNSIETGDGLLIMSSSRAAGHRNLLRRKNVAINSTMGTGDSDAGIDILSNIMDTMNRWHTMSRPSTIEKIKINTDGSLECVPQPERAPHATEQQPNADILNAPMNSRNDNGANRNFNNSNGFRGSNNNQNAGQYSQNRFGNRSEQTSFQPFQRAGNFNEGGFGMNFQQDNFSPRNRLPFQRQRNNNSRLLRNQFQPQSVPQQGLYDGEDIPQIADMPTQCNYLDGSMSSVLMAVQIKIHFNFLLQPTMTSIHA